jgi:hypothetical protein
MEPQNNERLPLELTSQLVAIMTTEHYTLQTGRSMTIAEANGRAALFVGAVSSGLVALALVGQLSHLGTAFFVFSLVVLPTLFLMGVITFERVIESGSDDLIYARGINRIRHLYLEYAPQMQPYIILSTHDESSLPIEHLGTRHRARWQVFLSMAGIMAMLNSVLAGSFVGLGLSAFSLPLVVTTSAGGVTFLASVALHQCHQWRQWRQLERHLTVLFPSHPSQ